MTEAIHLAGILFIGYFLSSSGRSRCVCEDLSSRFQQRGNKIITTSRMANRCARLVDMIATIIRSRHDYQIASVEVYNGLAFMWAEISCGIFRLLHKPYVITLHGARMLQFAHRWPRRIRRLLQGADLATTPSRLFQQRLSHIRSDIVYIPNGIDWNLYPYRLRAKPTPRLGWLRKFENTYNPVMAVKALSLLRDEFPSIKLIMSGADRADGSRQEVMQLAGLEGLEPCLEITGFVPRSEIPAWFSRSDIYINTTNVESFGIAVMEAAAAGLCIVTTNAGELAHLWKDGEDALVVPCNDAAAMASAVRRILTEPHLAARLSENARAKAKNFDWSVIVPQWEAIFERLKAHG